MPLAPGRHLDLLNEALELEAQGQAALLSGDTERGKEAMRGAADLYRRSWEHAQPDSYGRLIGLLKAAVIGGAGEHAAAYVREQLNDFAASPAAGYALAIAALVQEQDALAANAAETMREGSPAFVRAADAIVALAERDARAYERAVRAIVADFETRDRHLTGVAIADTALMLELLAAARGLACSPSSPLLPTLG